MPGDLIIARIVSGPGHDSAPHGTIFLVANNEEIRFSSTCHLRPHGKRIYPVKVGKDEKGSQWWGVFDGTFAILCGSRRILDPDALFQMEDLLTEIIRNPEISSAGNA